MSSKVAEAASRAAEHVLQHPIQAAAYVVVAGASLVFLLVAYVVYLSYLRPNPLRHIPGPPAHPLLGNFLLMAKEPGALAEVRWSRQYAKDGMFRTQAFFGKPGIAFLRPKALRKILVEEPYLYPKPPQTSKLLALVAGRGLLTIEGEPHKKMRKTMNQAFSLTSLIDQFPVYYDKIYPMVEVMQRQIDAAPGGGGAKANEAIIDVDALAARALLDIISLTAFGYDTDSIRNPDAELYVAYHQVGALQTGKNQAMLMPLLQIPGTGWLLDKASDWSDWSGQLAKLEKGSKLRDLFLLLNGMHRIKRVSREILRLQLNSGERVALKPGSKAIIDIIEETNQSENESRVRSLKEAEDNMIIQVLTFLGAGHETTTSGVSWTLWNLATHPEKQDKLRAECKALLDSEPRPPYSAIKALTYLDAVVNETMRLTPPVPRTLRYASKDDVIDGTFVPKGTLLPIFSRAINTFPETWGDDAMEFRPERWSDLPAGYDRTFSMLTFLAGAHGCIGRTMSYLEMKAMVAVLVANFRFEPIEKDYQPVMEALITMKPQGGLPLRVSKV
ncbi:uncharacterized protein PFL1_04606 [Pseudozyma flocculosa PF-1]|uniref:Related to Cytochrome P450 n=2 Tax=Pseudozyma flocculosa TaxID=84751 RepID=A0A5C3FC83_9BASI|nr:uncharacterized protein PFL1_04606 [Pseudozyma flocculosa PF-1]EPQ27862.1 hypothetical protein PFL1_04606 [Pseudozyma flocculosa PF-1]SPO41009.1 related to Cytochrome P450 [Pseudozyma flocculosa]